MHRHWQPHVCLPFMAVSDVRLLTDSNDFPYFLFFQSFLTRWQYQLLRRLCPKWRVTRYSSPARCLGPQSSTLTYQLVGIWGPRRMRLPRLRSWSPCQETSFCALEGLIGRGWQLGISGWIRPAPRPTGWRFTSCSPWTRGCSTARPPNGFRTQTGAGLRWPASRARRPNFGFSPLVSELLPLHITLLDQSL